MKKLTLIVLLRFSIACGLVLVAVPFVARGPARALLGNLFELGFRGTVVVSMIGLVTAWTVLVTGQLTYRYGPLRADLCPRPRFGPAFERFFVRWRWLLALLLITPMLGAVVAARGSATSSLVQLPAVLAGILAGFALLVGASIVELWLAPARRARTGGDLAPRISGLLPRLPLSAENQRIFALVARRAPPIWVLSVRDAFARLARWLGPGYLDRRRRLLPGHLVGSSLLLVSTLVYFLLGVIQYPGHQLHAGEVRANLLAFPDLPSPGLELTGLEAPVVPALAYLLQLILVFALLLPAVGFYFDRLRLPVVSLLMLGSILSITISRGQHFFAIAPLAGERTPELCKRSDEELLPELLFYGPGPAVVAVAAAGGGITSAAWTAEVLTRLGEDPATGPAFLDSLRLVSSVSGGSVGSLFFVDRLPPPPRPAAAAEAGEPCRREPRVEPLGSAAGALVRDAAAASTLEPVTWGFSYPDLLRALPTGPAIRLFWPLRDRSWALETAWARRLRGIAEPATGTARQPTLADWREEARCGAKPLVVFNSTVVETGGYFHFSSLSLAEKHRTTSFWRAYPRFDVPMVTAARLSATFPFISPAAQARVVGGVGDERLPTAHLVDGGYYENSGALTAIEVLDRALEDEGVSSYRRLGKPILILRLQPFSTPEEHYQDIDGAGAWSASFLAPFQTMLAVRTGSQVGRGALELEAFQERWRQGANIAVIDVPLGNLGPLSWQLTLREKDRIGEEWQRLAAGSCEIEKLRCVLSGQSYEVCFQQSTCGAEGPEPAQPVAAPAE